MPRAGELDTELAVLRRKDSENYCGKLVYGIAKLLAQYSMQVLQHRHRVGVEDRRSPQRVAGQGSHRGGAVAFSTHITDEESPLVMPEREQVVEISTNIVRGGGVVVRRCIQAFRGRKRGRQQRPLQSPCEFLNSRTFLFHPSSLIEEFALVRAPIACAVNRDAQQKRSAVDIVFDVSGEERGKPCALGGDQIHGNAGELTVHLQHWRKMSFVVYAATYGQQVCKRFVDQRFSLVPEPRQKGGVHADDA